MACAEQKRRSYKHLTKEDVRNMNIFIVLVLLNLCYLIQPYICSQNLILLVL